MESEIPPLRLISLLLGASFAPAQRCGLALVKEAAKQHLQLPTLQAFEWLLLAGDRELKDREVIRFLRNEFAKSNADIPPVQFCTALRSLYRGGAARASDEPPDTPNQTTPIGLEKAQLEDKIFEVIDHEEMRAFLECCTEKVRVYFSSGLTLQCGMAIAEALYLLGCRDDAFYAKFAAFVKTKRRRASPSMHSADAAKVICLALGEDLLDASPDVHQFLLEVEASGVAGESRLSPTEWMNRHDPANFIAPLTEEQQEGWDVIEKMVRTRSDDRDSLIELATRYIHLLETSRPDDLKYFFGVFEEKVLKEDRVLKDCLESLLRTQIVSRLSATTIAGILHSLAALRFAYTKTVKQFLSGVTAEQWAEMDAPPLVQILAAMSTMSLRIPAVLAAMGERLLELSPFLSPHDTAAAIRGLQALSFPDEAVLTALIRHAASCAGRFDEASMVLLFTAPSIHRLLRPPEVAGPLLKNAAAKIGSLPLRQRIAGVIQKAGLPRQLMETSKAQLGIEDRRPSGVPLRLT
ncbi:unnamed protein product [Phytomonas sp. EM1]|nr:unnamed protein product [Phytomonas sp. EM1]|eukprot:CCW63172.1 unnamed protein product [Phytomonas sp. isolate EM1]